MHDAPRETDRREQIPNGFRLESQATTLDGRVIDMHTHEEVGRVGQLGDIHYARPLAPPLPRTLKEGDTFTLSSVVKINEAGVVEVLEPGTWTQKLPEESHSQAANRLTNGPHWKGECLLARLTLNEWDEVLNDLSGDVARIKACREPISPDPQCSGPGYAHAAHGNCSGYGTDRT